MADHLQRSSRLWFVHNGGEEIQGSHNGDLFAHLGHLISSRTVSGATLQHCATDNQPSLKFSAHDIV